MDILKSILTVAASGMQAQQRNIVLAGVVLQAIAAIVEFKRVLVV